MPKADRCATLKKESQSTRKKVVSDQRTSQKEQETLAKQRTSAEEERLAAESAQARQAGPSKVQVALKAGKSTSTFNKAASTFEPEAEQDDGSGDEDYEVVPTNGHGTNGTNGNGNVAAVKKEAPAKKKTKAQQAKEDMAFLAAEQKAAMYKRITDRLLRLFVVGYVMDSCKEVEQRPAAKENTKAKKKGSKEADSSQSWSVSALWDKANKASGSIMMLVFTVFLAFLVIAGQDYDPGALQASGVNLYADLGLPVDSDILAVRKAYKNLAVSWHPDKNPGCEACPARFEKIGEAYEILSNPEKKKAYDERRAPDGSLDSGASVDLTVDDFEASVLRSNDVWFVQVYEGNGGMSKSFHPMWEDVAHKNEQLGRFGRIDVQKHRKVLRFLPQRLVLFPVVFRFARGYDPELFQPDFGREEQRSSNPLSRFVMQKVPQALVLSSATDLKAWWGAAGDRPRILVSGPLAQQKTSRGGAGRELLQAHRSAFLWAEFMDIAFCEMPLAASTLGKEVSGKGSSWSVALRHLAGTVETRQAASKKEFHAQLEELIPRGVADLAPHLTVRNSQQLCGMHHSSRTYCLFLVDATEDRVAAALAELNDSRKGYAEEVLEAQNADDALESTEELFHVQLVRVSTSSSRMPWEPVGTGASFKAVWAEAQHASSFVFELDTRRIGTVKTTGFRELYQTIGYDDMKFQELSEGVSFTRGLADPEVPLMREMQHALATPLGAICAFVLAACAMAVAPELSVFMLGASSAAFVSVLIVLWPLATRRFVSLFWCISSSSFECQIGA